MLIECGNCQCKIRVPESTAGAQGKCPKCGTVLTIPDAPLPPSAPVTPVVAANEDPSNSPTVVPDPAGTPQPATVAGEMPAQAATTENLYAFLAPPQAADELGRLGAYRVLRVLGQGGMGVVFLAEDPHLGRQVALKAMLPEVAKKPAARDRFLREARTAAAIEHDHIVAIYQVGEDRGVPFIAMPLLKGCSLEDWLRTQHDRPLPVPLILKLGKQVAEGLAAAHAHGLIHRDIKPANIFLQNTARGSATGKEQDLSAALSLTVDDRPPTADFRVKVLDFGLARSSAGDQNLTQSGVIMGTPAYMAPEQARSGSKIDARADLFSLGVVLYRLCTGKLPFKGEDMMSTLMALGMDTPTTPAAINLELPLTLSDLVMQLLAKDPKDRVGSAEEVVKRLDAIETSFIAAMAALALDKPAAWGAQEVPVVQRPPNPDPYKLTVRELPTPTEHVPPRPRRHDEQATEPRRRQQADDDEDRMLTRSLEAVLSARRRQHGADDETRDDDPLIVQKEDTMLSMISMIVGIASAVLAVFSMCCCGVVTGPVAGIGGGAAIVLGVMGHKRGGRNYAVTGISLGVVAVLLALASLALFGLGMGMNLLGKGRGFPGF
jgi:serine/threonine protein kinase